jgi:hypothetical protein
MIEAGISVHQDVGAVKSRKQVSPGPWARAFPKFPLHDDCVSPSTKGTLWRTEGRENRFSVTDADQLSHNRFTIVASLRS